MMSRLTTISYLLVAGLLAVMFGCTDPADAIDMGELCLPDTDDCSRSAQLHRDSPGRNALDLFLTNQTTDKADSPDVRVRVTTPEELSLPDDRPYTDDGHLILYDEEFAPGGGDTVFVQLDGYHLTVVSQLRLEFDCLGDDCAHHLEYLYFADSVECIDSGVCGRTEFCEQVYGRCAECHVDDDCSPQQTCRRETGRCYPGESTGCHSVPSDNSPLPPGWPAIVVIAGIVAVRTFRRLPVAGSAAVAGLLVVTVPATGAAEMGASLNAGGGLRILTGETGTMTTPGWGVNVNQQLRWRQLGMMVELSTHTIPLDAQRPPQGSNISGYGITAGPRGFVPVPLPITVIGEDDPIELIGAVDYTLWNVAENRLASVTGLQRRYHALGPTLGVAWQYGGLAVTARANYSHIFDWPGGVISLSITVGIGH